MKRHQGSFVLAALALAILMAGCWGSSKSTSLDVGVASQPARVGFQQCINTCHATTPDHITDLEIKTTWTNSMHYIDGRVECEDCHGNGGNHWGVGPIPEPNPAATCAACHGFTGFTATRHFDQQGMPGPLFFQADAGTGQAEYFGQPEFLPDGVTPVTRAQHIEECSRCHNPSQEFRYARDGSLDKPEPSAMPAPHVSCGGCHDGHDPVTATTLVTQRAGADVHYPRFRNYLVDPNSGAQTDCTAVGIGLTTLNLAFQPNGAVLGLSTPDITRVVGGNNELLSERLCASCHAKGAYRYSQVATHQSDIYIQWTRSGHGDRAAAAFGEFSAKPSFYDPTFPEGTGSHQSIWPFDMALGSNVGGGGQRGATATTTQNAAVASSTGFNDNYQCYKCHNGLTSLAYQDNVEGTPAAPVVFGDEPVTCVTCHDPHANVPGQGKNTRRPVVFTKYTSAQVAFSGNVFLDNTPVPPQTGDATICVFCHQGRESGFTVYKVRGFATAVNDNLAGASFTNPHYLGTGAMLWGRNAYEYAGKSYSNNEPHQVANCITCHMRDATADSQHGGHTWNPNFKSCNTASCHGGTALPAIDNDGTAAPNPDVYRMASDTNNYTGLAGGATQPIAQSIQTLQDNVIALLAAQGIYYDDTAYPYFHNVPITVADGEATNHARTTAFTNWTKKTYRAAFNLQYIIKGLPSAGTSTTYVVNGGGVRVPDTSQTLVPNASAATHNYRYIIQLLRDGIEDLTGTVPPGTRPAGNLRPATAYGTGQ